MKKKIVLFKIGKIIIYFIVLNVLSYGSQLMVLVLILLDPSNITELSMEKTVTGICAYLIDGGTVPA